jgi:RNase P subunit RPR2
MGKRKLAFSELRRIDRGPRAAVSFESEEDLPPLPEIAKKAYESNRQLAALMAMDIGQTVRVWYCHNCRRLINLAECEQPDLADDVRLINCVRCGLKAAELAGTFGQNLLM